MKTRIRVVEKNNGYSEYYCEKYRVKYLSITSMISMLIGCILVGISTAQYILLSGILLCFSILNLIFIIQHSWVPLKSINNILYTGKKESRFLSLAEAKQCIDSYLKEIKEENILTHNRKTKSTTYIKYP